MDFCGSVSIELYLPKEAVGWIRPVGYGLLALHLDTYHLSSELL